MTGTLKPESPNGVIARINRMRALQGGNCEVLIRSVRRGLADRSPRVRGFAVMIAREQDLRELEPHVRELLEDISDFVRGEAVEYLGDHYAHEKIEASWLYPLLEDSAMLVRVETLESLAVIEDRKALPLVAAKLRDSDELVRAYAATAISDLKARRYIKAIHQADAAETTDLAKVRYAAALYTFGEKAQFHRLIAMLQAPYYRDRCAAANFLTYLDLDSNERWTALQAVHNAKKNYLYRSDQTTMERVEKELTATSQDQS